MHLTQVDDARSGLAYETPERAVGFEACVAGYGGYAVPPSGREEKAADRAKDNSHNYGQICRTLSHRAGNL